jgi:hypothetical protein
MKKRYKLFIGLMGIFALFAAWVCGVGMGQSNAGRNAEHSMMVNSTIILKEIEKGTPDTAANWCKTFIVSGERSSRSKDPIFPSFLHYLRYNDVPELPKSIAEKVEEVKRTYKPNIVDLSNYKFKKTDSGFSVEVPIHREGEQAAPSNR